ncbi:MAG: histidine triad nucleotide-binding protein [Candidatus Marinimicrobia bacterium]|nr:histidine triad nucleotide-binding protein [Candidatus Neomarinimicrobiota bacterium]|tara:strand:- start:267 stop:611 length:345 start_codon:yes stop_codon:yes gene_type:complete
MDNCLFCKIIYGQIPSNKVYEDEFTFAFRDINPVAPVHILVIPKLHISGLTEINHENSDVIIQITETARKICKIEGLESDGFRYVINSGKYGGQTVFHLHLHLLGGRKLNWPPG